MLHPRDGNRRSRLKVGVVGCGALGSYYGAQLCRAGHEVWFLLRSDYEVVCAEGVRIRSGESEFVVRPRCAREPGDVGVCDVVLIGLKTTANRELGRLVPPLVGPGTAVVSLQNGLGDEELLSELVGADRVLGGLCFVCLNRVAPGVVRHSAYGLVVLGEHGRAVGERTRRLAAMFQEAGIPCRLAEDLARAHWEKLVWNVPFNGLGVAGTAGYESVVSGEVVAGGELGPTLATDVLLGDARWEGLVRELMLEVVSAARGQGYAVEVGVVEEQLERTRTMGAYRASTLVDWDAGRELELESLFEEPRRRAERAGVRVPRLTALCRVLRVLEARRQQSASG